VFALKQKRLNYLKVARAPFALPFLRFFFCIAIFEISARLWTFLFPVLTVFVFGLKTQFAFGLPFYCAAAAKTGPNNQLILYFVFPFFYLLLPFLKRHLGHLLPFWPNRFIAVNPPAIAASPSESCCSSAPVPHPLFGDRAPCELWYYKANAAVFCIFFIFILLLTTCRQQPATCCCLVTCSFDIERRTGVRVWCLFIEEHIFIGRDLCL